MALFDTVTWTRLLIVVPLPWPVAIMAIFLLLYWQYFKDRWWPKETSVAREISFGSTDLTADETGPGMLRQYTGRNHTPVHRRICG